MHIDGGPIRWYVRQDAETRGKPVVFLHGFAGTGADWDETRAALPHGWRGIAPDLPGHGESPCPPALSFDKFPGMVSRLLDSLGIDKAVFVGYSLGARLSLALATQIPSRIEGLVLESVHPGLATAEERDARRERDESDARTLEMEGLDSFLEMWHQRPVFAARRDGPGWQEEVTKKRTTNHPRRLAAVMRGLGLSRQPDFIGPLALFQAPMLLVAGEKDPPYVAHARRLAAQRPDARRLLVAPCGHNVHTEQPLVFRDALHAFLQTFPHDA